MERQLSGIGPVKLFLYRSLSNQPHTQIYIFLEEKKKESYLRNNKHDLRIISMRSDCLALSSLQP